MKQLKYLLGLLTVLSLALLVGCGGGGGGSSSDDPDPDPTPGKVKFEVKSFIQDEATSSLILKILSNTKLESLTVASPKGYNVISSDNINFTITGDAIANKTDKPIKKSFSLSYVLDGKTKSQSVSVSVDPNDIGQKNKVTVTAPTAKYNNAVKLQYSAQNHKISVKTTLTTSLQSSKLNYIWTVGSGSGTKIKNTDSVYESAEFIYRPNDTSYIPADVTTGTTRKYNRGFKINNTLVGKYIYLTVKTESGKTVGTVQFYVDTPATPPVPTR